MVNDSKMTATEAVAALNELTGSDAEADHLTADNILLAAVPHSVRIAYEQLVERADWWAYA